MMRCPQCQAETPQVTICPICKFDHMAEFDKKRAIQRQRSLEVKQRTAYLTNGVYAPSKVERDYANN